MSSKSNNGNNLNNENMGSYRPPVAPRAGDDGFVAPGSVDISKFATKDSNRSRALINASELRSQIEGVLNSVASQVDYSRDNFAKTAVATCRSKWPEFNWVACHTAHSYLWMGARGVDWEHWHYELDVYGPGTIGYEFYWAREGVFTRQGDGGFINWAYIGNVQQIDDRTLYFSRP